MTNLVHLYGFYEWWCIAHVLPYCLYAFESIIVGDIRIYRFAALFRRISFGSTINGR